MGINLDELASYMQPKAAQLLIACNKAGVSCRVVDTGRTAAQQIVKIQTGVSWVKKSKHEPQAPEMKSEAIDIVPFSILSEHKPDWDPGHPDWQKIGALGEALGLTWGGRWVHNPDPSHFEWKEPAASALPELGMTD